MLAVYAASTDADRPLRGLTIGDRPDPAPPAGWTTVRLRAAGLNHHDVWTLRGVGVDPARLPMILGCEGAGVDELGREVIVHPVVGDAAAGNGDATLDPGWRLLSGEYDGTFADAVAVPAGNLVPKPAELSFEEAACLSGAWLTAYRMVFDRARLRPASTVLVQGAGGGVSTALVVLAAAAGHRVWVTGRSEARRDQALALGAAAAFPPGARLPDRVDAVFETVGLATWKHSVDVLRPGGTLVVAGATAGSLVPTDLRRVFYRQLSIVGSSLGTRAQLAELTRLCVDAGIRPAIGLRLPLQDARRGFEALMSGDVFGKVVFTR